MAETKVAKNSLKGAIATSGTKTIYDVIKAGAKQFAAALPKHIDSDRFTRIAITTIRQNPKLAQCTQESLLGALMTSAQLGLEPGVLGQCYLIPYGRECQFQISYKGMIELLRRSGQLKDIYAYSVYSNDEFEMIYGLKRDLIHKPKLNGEKGELIGCYCVAILKDGTTAFEFMTKEELEMHMKRFSKTYNNGPWKTDFEAMAHKTVVKKMLKWLPVSVEFLENVSKDEKTFIADKDIKEVKEVEVEVFDDNAVIDAETGEIISDKATDEDRKNLLIQAEVLKINLKEVVKNELKIDFDDMTKDDVTKISNLIDELIDEKM